MKKGRGFSLLQTIRRSFSTFQNSSSQMDQSERYCFKPALKWNPKVEEYFVKAYGADRFARISQALTHPSCYSCIRVNTLKSTTDAVIQKLHAVVEEAGSANASDSNQGAMEPLLDAGACMENSQATLISKCRIPGLDYVVFVKGSGPHTIDYGYAPNKPPKEVIVSRKCAEAVLRGAQVYVPGVMACSAHVEKGDVVAVSAAVEQPATDGRWGINMTRGTVLQGNQNDPYYYERDSLYIGQGITAMSRAGIFRALEGVAVDMTNQVYRLPSLNDVLQGEIFLQNLPSIVAAHALDPQKGERILDMCAAPGGKTTAIAILMKDEGEVIAADRSHNKVLDIQKLAAELSLNCITPYKLDALKAVCKRHESDNLITSNGADSNNHFTVPNSMNSGSNAEGTLCSDTAELSIDVTPTDKVRSEKGNGTYISRTDIRKSMRRLRNGPGRNQSVGGRVENSKGFPPHSFDRVLLDAPCSALGLRPRLFSGEETMESLRNHGKYQRRMFDQAVQLVRPGGILVYSTCTINPGENEALVRYALDTYTFLSLAPQHPKIGGPGLIGDYEYPDGSIEEWLRPGEETLVQRFDPSSSLDTIGFFIAKFSVNHEM